MNRSNRGGKSGLGDVTYSDIFERSAGDGGDGNGGTSDGNFVNKGGNFGFGAVTFAGGGGVGAGGGNAYGGEFSVYFGYGGGGFGGGAGGCCGRAWRVRCRRGSTDIAGGFGGGTTFGYSFFDVSTGIGSHRFYSSGGGDADMGGAVFSMWGNATVLNSTLAVNTAQGGNTQAITQAELGALGDV